jgi:GNAT superfamily N-acetyltransferase
MSVAITEGVPEALRTYVASLFLEAFAAKLRPVFGGGVRGAALLAASLRLDRALLATRDGACVGVAGFCLDGTRLVENPGLWRLFRARGPSGGVGGWLAAVLLHRAEPLDALLLDGIAVAPAWRGHGIGTGLLAAARDLARRHGRASVQLAVIDTNPAARRLYLREGFAPVREQTLGALGRWLFGFGAVTTMRRGVA